MAADLGRSVVNPRAVRVVHNGIDVSRFGGPADPALRAELTNGTDRPLVLSLARLHWQKGLKHLVAAARQVPSAVFVVAGAGEERAHLDEEVARSGVGDRFRFLGFRDDAPRLLAACDLFVLPSLFEGLPVSVLEALAARRPVVATAVGGTGEAVIDGETGLLVPPAESDGACRRRHAPAR